MSTQHLNDTEYALQTRQQTELETARNELRAIIETDQYNQQRVKILEFMNRRNSLFRSLFPNRADQIQEEYYARQLEEMMKHDLGRLELYGSLTKKIAEIQSKNTIKVVDATMQARIAGALTTAMNSITDLNRESKRGMVRKLDDDIEFASSIKDQKLAEMFKDNSRMTFKEFMDTCDTILNNLRRTIEERSA